MTYTEDHLRKHYSSLVSLKKLLVNPRPIFSASWLLSIRCTSKLLEIRIIYQFLKTIMFTTGSSYSKLSLVWNDGWIFPEAPQ